MTLRYPLMRAFSRWPDIWDDDLLDFSTTQSGLDVYETNDQVVIKANVAGVPADQVDLTFDRGFLSIRAQGTDQEEDKSKKHYSRSSWNYSYRVAVPGEVDYATEPEAEIEGGVLTVTFQKSEKAKPKKLTIKTK
jgi:HSP20 family protein